MNFKNYFVILLSLFLFNFSTGVSNAQTVTPIAVATITPTPSPTAFPTSLPLVTPAPPLPSLVPVSSPSTINCGEFVNNWRINSIEPKYGKKTVGFTISGNFPHITECGQQYYEESYMGEKAPLVWVYKMFSGSSSVREYHIGDLTEVESFSDTQIILKDKFEYSDGGHSFYVYYCKGAVSTPGNCTAGGRTATSMDISVIFPLHKSLAYLKSATQSSTFQDASASKAVDGDIDLVTQTNNEKEAWWQVDLGANIPIGDVRIWNRVGSESEKLRNFYVLVSGDPFKSTSLFKTRGQEGVSAYYHRGSVDTSTVTSVNRYGRYLRIQLDHTDYLSLAEVEVLSPVAVYCPDYAKNWKVNSIWPLYIGSKVGFVINGNFPKVLQCGLRSHYEKPYQFVYSYIYSREYTSNPENRRYNISDREQVRSVNESQIILNPVFTYSDDPKWEFEVYSCNGWANDGNCTNQGSRAFTGYEMAIKNPFNFFLR